MRYKDPKMEFEGQWFNVGVPISSQRDSPTVVLVPVVLIFLGFCFWLCFGGEVLSYATGAAVLWFVADSFYHEGKAAKRGPGRIWLGPKGLWAKFAGRTVLLTADKPLEYVLVPPRSSRSAILLRQEDKEVLLYAGGFPPEDGFIREIKNTWPCLEETLIDIYGRERLYPNYRKVKDDDHLDDWKVKW